MHKSLGRQPRGPAKKKITACESGRQRDGHRNVVCCIASRSGLVRHSAGGSDISGAGPYQNLAAGHPIFLPEWPEWELSCLLVCFLVAKIKCHRALSRVDGLPDGMKRTDVDTQRSPTHFLVTTLWSAVPLMPAISGSC